MIQKDFSCKEAYLSSGEKAVAKKKKPFSLCPFFLPDFKGSSGDSLLSERMKVNGFHRFLSISCRKNTFRNKSSKDRMLLNETGQKSQLMKAD